MDYLIQAKTFLHRAYDANDVEERMTHLNKAAEMLAKAIEELGQSRSARSLSGLSRQEEDVLAILQDRGSGPGQPVPVQSLLLAWGTRGSEGELFAAVKRLQLKGLLTTDATGYELTKAGSLGP
ncbi:MAG: hypothetical protein WEB63_00750 [Cucumibacter sp.]